MLVQVEHGRTIVGSPASLASARSDFDQRRFLKLPGFLDPTLRDSILDALDRAPFYERVHHGIGRELCVESGPLTGLLELLMNDSALFAAIDALTGCGPIGCFEGRIYRMVPGTDHHDSWHSDVGHDRLIAMSVNLGRETYTGGLLQIRRADSEDVLSNVENRTLGDAIIFQIDPTLRHRVDAVTGQTPRTAYAGWFRRQPTYQDLFRTRAETPLPPADR
jgi:hypothetical protein